MIRFVCSNCRQMLEMGPQYAGQQVRCSGCGQVLVVPATIAPVASPTLVSTPMRGGPIVSTRPKEPAGRPNTTLQITCAGCGQWLELAEDQYGKLVQCPKCGLTMQTPPAPGSTVEVRPMESPITDQDRRLKLQAYLWVLGGGLLGCLFGTSIGIDAGSDLVGVLRAIIGILLGAGIGAIFVAMWAFRLGALNKMGGWLVAGAIIGAVLGATFLSKGDKVLGALAGALLGTLLGTGGGWAGAAIWRHLDNREPDR